MSNSVFVHIPKTGGTSVADVLSRNGYTRLRNLVAVQKYVEEHGHEGEYLRGKVNIKHQRYSDLGNAGYIDAEFDFTAYKFTVVRHPFDRVVSVFRHLYGPKKTLGDFGCWIETEFPSVPSDAPIPFYYPQVSWIEPGFDAFKLENIQRSGFFGETLPRLNKTDTHTFSVKDLTQEHRMRIYELYQADFVTLGYSFLS